MEELAAGPLLDDASPITGGEFREWSDRMRDVEELVADPRLRNQAAQIRDRARGFRREFQRHSKEPKWDLVRDMVVTPLKELQVQITEELLRRSAEKTAIVPIDRDPVPQRFQNQVERYFEQLGSGK